MPALIKLSELPVSGSATVRELPKQGAAFLRLREMGLTIGTALTLLRTAPMGDPIEIKLRSYNLSLRKSEAEQILVEPTVK